MARIPVPSGRPKTSLVPDPVVEAVPLPDATRVATVGPDWEGWLSDRELRVPAGSFLRLRPPPGVEPSRLARVEERLRAAGASVLVERPPASSPAEPAPGEAPRERPHRRAREVVVAIASASAERREELVPLVESLADRVGL
jgi:hypothetical protein